MNEQPMLADLFEPPAAADVSLRCTRLRTMNGKRPVFVDDSDSIFLFPYIHIRFLEIPPTAVAGSDGALAIEAGGGDLVPIRRGAPVPEVEPDLEIDEDFLRRIREV
jgi:hypothetical protein